MSHLKLDPIQALTYTDKEDMRNPPSFINEFVLAVNEDILFINQSITAYNRTLNAQKKQQILHTIYQQLQTLNNKYPLDMVNDCNEYTQHIQVRLYEQLIQQTQALSLNSVLEISDTNTRIYDGRDQLTDILANLSSKKLAEFARLLLANGESNTALLLSALSDTPSPSPELVQFLETHTIEIIGQGNTRLYKISHIAREEEPFILKLEERTESTNEIKEMLIESQISLSNQPFISNTFDRPITSARQIRYPEYTRTDAMVITDYCEHGNILSYVQELEHSEKKISHVIEYGLQLNQILQTLQDKNVVFIDVKPENFLLDGEHRIRVSDMKSFRFTGMGGKYYPDDKQNRWMTSQLPFTRYMRPPEIIERTGLAAQPFSADKFHSYTLGKMLYVSLLDDQFDRDSLTNCHEGSLFDFGGPIFQTEQGQKIQLMIMETVKENPDKRLSLPEVQVLLTQIKNGVPLDAMTHLIELKKSYRDMASQFTDLRLDDKNKIIALIQDYQDQISGAMQAEELNLIRETFIRNIQKSIFIEKQTACYESLKPFDTLRFGPQDIHMQQLIEDYEQQIKFAENVAELELIQSAITKKSNDLQNDPSIQRLTQYINRLKTKSFSEEKIASIMQAISNTPIEARSFIEKPLDQVEERYQPYINDVQQALKIKRITLKNIIGSVSTARAERTHSGSSMSSTSSIDKYKATVSKVRSTSREHSTEGEEKARTEAKKGDKSFKLMP